ncbi:MAG: Gfo/Idh/MocA family protein [Phycisphaerales bacterium]
MTPLRFGILGTGNIARQFARGVAGASRSVITAVASRSNDKARQFASDHNIPQAHGSYDALLADPNVDAIYLSLPNSMHCQWTLQSLEAGKHVLCEKPLAANLDEAHRMFDAARRTHRVLVEAFMYRCFPLMRQVRQAVRDGAIGRLRLVRCSFNYFTSKIDGNVRFDASLAGGALMDIGCYCIDFARLMIGAEPLEVQARGVIHPSGVDEMVVAFMTFPDETSGSVQCSFTCGMRAHADNSAYLCGSDGYIVIPIPWKPPAKDAIWELRTMPRPQSETPSEPPRVAAMTGSTSGGGPTTRQFTVDTDKPLFALEADAFAAIVLDGATPFITEADSIANMKILDIMRKQIGLDF